MNGKIEVTIPMRQYENIKITYDFVDKEEKDRMIGMALSDCIKLHNWTGRKIAEENKAKNPPVPEEISGVKWRFHEGKWEYLKEGVWIGAKPGDVIPVTKNPSNY